MNVSRISARGVSKILTPINPSPNWPTDVGSRPIVADTFTHRPRTDNNKRRINSHRFQVNTSEKAKQLLESWGLHERRKPFTVVEMFAGNGIITKELLKLPNVKKIVCFEDGNGRKAPGIKAVFDKANEMKDTRLLRAEMDVVAWATWNTLRDEGILNTVESAPWEEENDSVFFIAVGAENNIYERFMIQLMTSTQGRFWLWRHFGRFKIGMLTSDKFYQRCAASPGSKERHKSAVLNEMLVHIQSSMTPRELQTPPLSVTSRVRGVPINLRAFTVTPLIQPFIHSEDDLDMLEFLGRKLFTLKVSPLKTSLKSLAPGAEKLLDTLAKEGNYIDAEKTPQQLDRSDWLNLLRAFKNWPFRPLSLIEDTGALADTWLGSIESPESADPVSAEDIAEAQDMDTQ